MGGTSLNRPLAASRCSIEFQCLLVADPHDCMGISYHTELNTRIAAVSLAKAALNLKLIQRTVEACCASLAAFARGSAVRLGESGGGGDGAERWSICCQDGGPRAVHPCACGCNYLSHSSERSTLVSNYGFLAFELAAKYFRELAFCRIGSKCYHCTTLDMTDPAGDYVHSDGKFFHTRLVDGGLSQ